MFNLILFVCIIFHAALNLCRFFVFSLNLKGSSSSSSTTRTAVPRNRGRILRTAAGRGSRGGSVIMGSSRSVVPAPYVPEELISQVTITF